MDIKVFNEKKDILSISSYNVIRRKINDFEDESNNDEIAGYVKGVIALQTEMYKNYEKEYINDGGIIL